MTAGVNALGASSTLTVGDNIGSPLSANLNVQASNLLPTSTALVLNSDGRIGLGTATASVSTIAGTGQIDLGTTGSLVVGDSHHYASTPDPFAPEAVDELILDEFRTVTGVAEPRILARWTGTYSSAPDRMMFIDRPADSIRLVMITSGPGASTSFAIAEEVIADLYGQSGAIS